MGRGRLCLCVGICHGDFVDGGVMSLYKITRDKAFVVIGCGHEAEFNISDLLVSKNVVLFPVCPTCRKAFYVAVSNDRPEGTPQSVLDRDVIVHTLHKRVFDLGHVRPGEDLSTVVTTSHGKASQDDVVEIQKRSYGGA